MLVVSYGEELFMSSGPKCVHVCSCVQGLSEIELLGSEGNKAGAQKLSVCTKVGRGADTHGHPVIISNNYGNTQTFQCPSYLLHSVSS